MSDNKQIAAALSAPFNAEDLKQRPGRGGLVFTYADARAVAQRLDDVLGVEGWQFEVAVADVARSVVKGSLAVVLGGKTVVREDFGYPNSAQDDEPLKSAASDALRRCAAQLGVGRSLYGSGSAPQSIKTPPQAVSPVSVAPRAVPEASGRVESMDAEVALAAAVIFAGGECPDHRVEWTLKPAGISKAGKPYEAFYTCSQRTNGEYCKRKPAAAWITAQASKQPAAESIEDTIASLPF